MYWIQEYRNIMLKCSVFSEVFKNFKLEGRVYIEKCEIMLKNCVENRNIYMLKSLLSILFQYIIKIKTDIINKNAFCRKHTTCSLPYNRGGLCPGVSVQGVSVQGVSVQGVFVQGSLSRVVSVLEVSLQGGLCPEGGVSVQGFSIQGSLSRGISLTDTPHMNRITDRCKNITFLQLRCGQ